MLEGATVLKDEVVTDGNITTSRGMGTAIAFGLEILKLLDCETEAGAMKNKIIYHLMRKLFVKNNLILIIQNFFIIIVKNKLIFINFLFYSLP